MNRLMLPGALLGACVAAVVVLGANPLAAADLRLTCAGVLGNSGAEGEHLVRFDARSASGIGVVHDRYGTLWDRGGMGTLNRYALDGRLLAQYHIPPGSDRNTDQIALVDDTLVVLVKGRLQILPVDAPAGSTPTTLDLAVQAMSPSSWNGKVAVVQNEQLALFDPQTGAATTVANGGGQWIELDEAGALYAVRDWKLHKFVDGQPVTDGWPKACPGERPQRLGDHWYGHTWHGTMKRFKADLQPDPGVVLGGASGSFIGHLDENSELVNGRGVARLRNGLFAVSGIEGILHLLEWDPRTGQMTIVRRIGCVPRCSGLAIDLDGNVFFHAGSWAWSDRPDTPLRFGVNGPEAPGVGQPVMINGRAMCAPAFLWGKPAFYSGQLDTHTRAQRVDKSCALRKGFVGSVSYKADGRRRLLVVDAHGAGQAFRIGEDGRYQGDEGDVTLTTTTPLKRWTSLGMTDAGVLLAAADGQIVTFARDGANWRETGRWSNWGTGAEQRFGATIYLHTDADRIWVADTERHRVLVFAAAGTPPLAAFGHTDEPGTGLDALSSPGTIAACQQRAVVHDGGNQRLLKLILP